MKNVARELICLDALVKGQSNAINSSFASILGWNGSVNSVKVDYRFLNSEERYAHALPRLSKRK